MVSYKQGYLSKAISLPRRGCFCRLLAILMLENFKFNQTMIQQLFELRGELPKKLYTIIEIIGLVLLLGIWQLIASINTTEEKTFTSETLGVYSNEKAVTNLQDAYVLIYDKSPIVSSELLPLCQEVASLQKPLLLITGSSNKRVVQSLQASVGEDLTLVTARPASNEKEEVYDAIADFTGSSIIDDNFFGEEEKVDITTNFLGSVQQIVIADNVTHLGNKDSWISNSLLPSPIEVVQSFGELWGDDNLLGNTAFSVSLNLMGYLLALVIALPIGFLIGLFPLFRALFSRNVDALRFVPLTAVTGLFIAWFGIGTTMKVQFLAFGIIVYLLPVVVQRIDEVAKVYVQTAYTLGASKWQQIRTVFIPAVASKISDDVRVLVAISWTYIIVAELVNASSGGIGALAYKSARQSNIDKVFAILLVIILIGFIQDKLFVLFDKLFFPHKHVSK